MSKLREMLDIKREMRMLEKEPLQGVTVHGGQVHFSPLAAFRQGQRIDARMKELEQRLKTIQGWFKYGPPQPMHFPDLLHFGLLPPKPPQIIVI